jgi:hypothetical protein
MSGPFPFATTERIERVRGTGRACVCKKKCRVGGSWNVSGPDSATSVRPFKVAAERASNQIQSRGTGQLDIFVGTGCLWD